MAESEAVSGGAMSDVGEGGGGGGGARSMLGGSLPPRKRLLAGLKQNGSWLAASSVASPTSPTTGHSPDGSGAMEGVVAEVSPSSAATASQEGKGGCTGCGAVESSEWKRLKRNGVVHRQCNSCALLFSRNMFCPHCLVVCADRKDPAVWLECCRCQRPVHVECEKKSSSSVELDAGSYECPDCVNVKSKEITPGAVGNRTKGFAKRGGSHCSVDAGNCTSSAATGAECSSSCKKTRLPRDPRFRASDGEARDAIKLEGVSHHPRHMSRPKIPLSGEAALAAFKLAAKASEIARANAAAKAATAVKKARVARMALDAAALAAQGYEKAQAEYRRITVISSSEHDGAMSDTRRERSEKSDVKTEVEDNPGGTTPESIGDEELARQLHRVINSSPRISRGSTPLRRKPSGKSGSDSNVPDSVRSWSRPGLSPPLEPRPQLKQQQTRPRSISHKEVKRLDSRVLKQEPKKSDEDDCQNSSQQPAVTTGSGETLQLVALKSEPVELSLTVVTDDSGRVRHQTARHASLDSMVKTEENFANGAAQPPYWAKENSATDVSQAAAMLDEVLMSEAHAEEYLSRVPGDTGAAHNEELGATASLTKEGVVPKVDAREPEEQEQRQTKGVGDAMDVDMPSSATTLPELPSASAVLVEGHDEPANGSDAAVLEENSGSKLTGEEPNSLPEGSLGSTPGKRAKRSSEIEISPLKKLAISAAAEQASQQISLKGSPGPGQGFPSGANVPPISSPPAPPVQTPLTTGSAGGHS